MASMPFSTAFSLIWAESALREIISCISSSICKISHMVVLPMYPILLHLTQPLGLYIWVSFVFAKPVFGDMEPTTFFIFSASSLVGLAFCLQSHSFLTNR